MTILGWSVTMTLIILLTFLAVSAGYVARGVENDLELAKDRVVIIHGRCK